MQGLEQFGTNFTPWDWAIVVAYLSGTVAIGLYVNRYIRSMDDYVVAGRSLRSFLAIATMVGTELGLVTVMFSAEKGFTGGFAAFHIGLIAGVGTLIVGLTGFIVVPLRRMNVMTVPEFYERRFGRDVRVFGGLILAGAGILNMGLFLRAGAIFVTALTGLGQAEINLSVIGVAEPVAFDCVSLIMAVLILLVLVYTILGGMVSVVITDYIQFVVLSFGMLVSCFVAWRVLGWTNIVDTVKTVRGVEGFNPFQADGGTGFGPSYVIWMIFTAGIVGGAVWPTALMRACAVKNEQVVKRLYIWSSIGFLVRFLLPNFLGICALVYFWHHADAHAFFFDQDLPKNEQLLRNLSAMPLFLGQILPVGLIGLVGAGMLAAFMSTHDSYLLCWSSVLVQDVFAPLTGGKLSTKSRLLLARLFILLIGIYCLIWSLWYPLGQDLWDYMAVSGAIYFTGAFTVLWGGLYWKRASRAGAYLALCAGSLAVLGLEPIQKALKLTHLEEHFQVEISSAHVGLAATGSAIVLMIVGSLLLPDRKPANEAST